MEKFHELCHEKTSQEVPLSLVYGVHTSLKSLMNPGFTPP
jgi:hypothetical protein